MMDESHDDDDSEDVAKILQKLRSSEEDQDEEAGLRAWMQSQQEVRDGLLGREGWPVQA